MQAQTDFTKGAIAPLLIRFSWPVLVAQLLQAAYGAVDLFVVGRYGDAAKVAAVSNGAQIMQVVTFMIGDLAMGSTVLLGRLLGEKQSEKKSVDDLVASTIILFFGVAVGATLLLELFTPAIVAALQVPSQAVPATVSYLRICASGMICIVAYNVLGSLFRGLGNSLLPLITVTIAAFFNVVGDFVLVGPLGLAEKGAAIATVASQLLSVLVSLWLIRYKRLDIHIGSVRGRQVVSIVRLGLPLAFQNCLVSISFLVTAAIVNSLGVVAAASVGVAEKVCGFLMLVPSSMSQAMSAFVAQNLGAGKPERARGALVWGVAISLGVGILMALLACLGGTWLGSLFTTDIQVARGAGLYLKAYAIDCVLVSFLFCMAGYAIGLGHTMMVMVQGLIGAFGVRIPVSFLMSKEVPPILFHIGLASPSSTFVQIVCFSCFFWWLSRKQKAF